MTNEQWLALGIFILGVVIIWGIFRTKTPGFGRFSTSVLLLAPVLIIVAMFFALGKIEASLFANVIFAIAGFAGGLLANRQERSNNAGNQTH